MQDCNTSTWALPIHSWTILETVTSYINISFCVKQNFQNLDCIEVVVFNSTRPFQFLQTILQTLFVPVDVNLFSKVTKQNRSLGTNFHIRENICLYYNFWYLFVVIVNGLGNVISWSFTSLLWTIRWKMHLGEKLGFTWGNNQIFCFYFNYLFKAFCIHMWKYLRIDCVHYNLVNICVWTLWINKGFS